MTENVNPFLNARDDTARAAEGILAGYTSDSRDELDALELEEEQINPSNHRSGSKEQGGGGRGVPPMMMGGGGGTGGGAGAGAAGAQAGSARAVAGTTQQTGMPVDAAGAAGAAGMGGKANMIAGGGAVAGTAGAGAAKLGSDSKGGSGGGPNAGRGTSGPIPGMMPGYSGGSYAPVSAGGVSAGPIPGFNAPAGTPLSGFGGTMAANDLQGSGWRSGVSASGFGGGAANGFGSGAAGGYGNGVGASGVRGSSYTLADQGGLSNFQPGPTRTTSAGGVTGASGGTNDASVSQGFNSNSANPVGLDGYSTSNNGQYGQHSGPVQGTSYSNSGTNTGVGGSGYNGGGNQPLTGSSSMQFDVQPSKVVDQASAWDQWSTDLNAIRSKIDDTRATRADFGNVEGAATAYQNTQERLEGLTGRGTGEFSDFSDALHDTAEKFEEGDQHGAEIANTAFVGGGVSKGFRHLA